MRTHAGRGQASGCRPHMTARRMPCWDKLWSLLCCLCQQGDLPRRYWCLSETFPKEHMSPAEEKGWLRKKNNNQPLLFSSSAHTVYVHFVLGRFVRWKGITVGFKTTVGVAEWLTSIITNLLLVIHRKMRKYLQMLVDG